MMKVSNITFGHGAVWLHRLGWFLLVAVCSAGPIAAAHADATAPAGTPAEASVTAWAMHWFTEMQAGRTDRSQYAAQVTDDAVRAMSHTLNEYGAAPLRAEIVQTRKIDEQTFCVVKFVFLRGAATSLLFGFDAAGKITAVGVGGLAGD
jgi:hypothetical protein